MGNKKYDACIIGGGPAGISAALYLKNAGFEVAVIHNNKSALKKAEHIRNYYGFYDGNGDLTGEKLYNMGLSQAKALGISVVEDEVFGVDFTGNFEVLTASEKYCASAVLIAAGEEKATLAVEGFSRFLTKGISFCAVCDAFFYRKKSVAVYGNAEYALHEAGELSHSAAKVTILTNGGEEKADFSNFEVNSKKIAEIFGKERLEGVKFEDGSTLEIDGLFVASESAGSVTLAKKIGAEIDTESGKPVIDANFKTSMDGLYIAGDTVNNVKQIASAVNSGMIAAFDMIKFLRKKK